MQWLSAICVVYGKVVALAVGPIEKKPFFNFLPGSRGLIINRVAFQNKKKEGFR